MIRLREVFRKLEELVDADRPAAAVVVTAAGGEQPGLVGARFVVTENGVEAGSDAPAWLLQAALHHGKEALWANRGGWVRHQPAVGADDEVQVEFFVDLAVPAPQLIIFGGGHISQSLAAMGSMIGFQVTVLDDRPLFANRERFPTARQVLCKPFEEAVLEVPITRASYVVIVTRGHRSDETCLRGVLHSPAGYIGMIGSRRRVGGVMSRLVEDGEPAHLVRRVHSPIGLDIGAQTPEEIAVSILAEIINVRRGGKAADASLHRQKV